jgi:hypothetical protein
MKSISSAIITLTGVGLVAVAPLYRGGGWRDIVPNMFMLSGIAIGLVGFVNWYRSLNSD